eukprot:1137053-Pelagomonas_calceolata.AAC.9
MHVCPAELPRLACKSTNCPLNQATTHCHCPGSLNWFAAHLPPHPLRPAPMLHVALTQSHAH